MIPLSRGVARAATLAALLSWCGRAPTRADAQPRPDASPSADASDRAAPFVAMACADARHTGRDDRRGPASEPSILWRVRTQRRVFASPVVDAHDRAIFGSVDGTVLAVDRGGVVRWGYAAPDRVFSSPAVLGELTVFGHDGDRLVAVDARGLERWSVRTTEDADAPPVLGPDGTIYFAAHDVLAVNPADGSVRWRAPLRSHAFGPPALAPDGTLYVPEVHGAVALFDTRAGTFTRRIDLPAPVYAGALVLDDGGLVVGALDGHLRAFASDGTLRWDFTAHGARNAPGIRATPALTRDGIVVVGAEDGTIYGLRAADGTEVFAVPTGYPVRGAARIDADGRIYVGGEDDTLRCLDANGTVRWSVVLGADIDGSPAILRDGTLVVGTDDGALYALGTPAR